MRIQRVANGMTFILLFLCILLVLLIYKQWTGSLQHHHQVNSNDNTATIDDVDTAIFKGIDNSNIQLNQFSEILARPIFKEGRMPYEATKTEQVANQQSTAPKLKLEGVVISPDSSVAVVRDETNNELVRLPIGAVYNGWKVSVVEPDEVTLKSDEKTHTIQLELINKPIVKSKRSGFRLPKSKKK